MRPGRGRIEAQVADDRPDDAALAAVDLTRRFGERLAVDNLSFAVAQGEVFGFLGPNGAGKTTTTRLLTGFLRPTGGQAWVAAYNMSRHPSAARRRMGMVPEEANAYADLTVWQNVMLMAELHGIPRAVRTARGRELLETFDLTERSRQKGRQLSKGLRQRLMLCMALVSGPDILFLDEPTSGLDVASTRLIRGVISRLNRERGMTIFLTTHNMEEADQLCHRVAIIDRGLLAAIDTPTALRQRIEARQSVEVRFTRPGLTAEDLLPGRALAVIPLADGFRVFTTEPGTLAQEIVQRAAAQGLRIARLNTLSPTLEDVFLSLTGRSHGTH
jgi:ABC-2 type transport system ATP-binding protein